MKASDAENDCADNALDIAALDVVGRRPFGEERGTIARKRLEPLLTVAQAATILNVSERTIRRLIASRAIDDVRIGRSVRIRRRVIERLIAR
jgi:excisionase family DNA binding protein